MLPERSLKDFFALLRQQLMSRKWGGNWGHKRNYKLNNSRLDWTGAGIKSNFHQRCCLRARNDSFSRRLFVCCYLKRQGEWWVGLQKFSRLHRTSKQQQQMRKSNRKRAQTKTQSTFPSRLFSFFSIPPTALFLNLKTFNYVSPDDFAGCFCSTLVWVCNRLWKEKILSICREKFKHELENFAAFQFVESINELKLKLSLLCVLAT